MSYFRPNSYSKNQIEVELDWSNYATKSDLNSATNLDTSQLAKTDDLANLKSEINEILIN